VKAVIVHILSCPAWASRYKQDPGGTLAPAEEHERWLRDDAGQEKAADLAGRVADTLDRRASMLARFRTADPLED
jgi:hypothetical protein